MMTAPALRVRLTAPPVFAASEVRGRGSVRAGLVYQAKVSRFFEAQYGTAYAANLWFEATEGSCPQVAGQRLFSPDGVLFDIPRGRITIVEVKRRHTSTAFTQLRSKYLPVLQAALEGVGLERPLGTACREGGGGLIRGGGAPAARIWSFHLVEVAPAYDPCDAGGEKVHLIRHLDQAVDQEVGMNFLPFRSTQPKWGAGWC
jgi:hypothetical protein